MEDNARAASERRAATPSRAAADPPGMRAEDLSASSGRETAILRPSAGAGGEVARHRLPRTRRPASDRRTPAGSRGASTRRACQPAQQQSSEGPESLDAYEQRGPTSSPSHDLAVGTRAPTVRRAREGAAPLRRRPSHQDATVAEHLSEGASLSVLVSSRRASKHALAGVTQPARFCQPFSSMPTTRTSGQLTAPSSTRRRGTHSSLARGHPHGSPRQRFDRVDTPMPSRRRHPSRMARPQSPCAQL